MKDSGRVAPSADLDFEDYNRNPETYHSVEQVQPPCSPQCLLAVVQLGMSCNAVSSNVVEISQFDTAAATLGCCCSGWFH